MSPSVEAGIEWQLDSIIAGDSVISVSASLYHSTNRPTVRFIPDLGLSTHGDVGGYGGCNRFFGEYVVSDPSSVSVISLGTTLMACGDVRGRVEREFYLRLRQVVAYAEKSGRLVLATEGDESLHFSSQ